MFDTQNQGPQCTACGSPMKLTAIEPSSTGQDLRTFSCPQCKRVQRHVIESAVTEAWLVQHRGNAVTHDVREGRMIPKPAK
jgi:tRNA(Ile2) C34 agmatinyltransferase TiaS